MEYCAESTRVYSGLVLLLGKVFIATQNISVSVAYNEEVMLIQIPTHCLGLTYLFHNEELVNHCIMAAIKISRGCFDIL